MHSTEPYSAGPAHRGWLLQLPPRPQLGAPWAWARPGGLTQACGLRPCETTRQQRGVGCPQCARAVCPASAAQAPAGSSNAGVQHSGLQGVARMRHFVSCQAVLKQRAAAHPAQCLSVCQWGGPDLKLHPSCAAACDPRPVGRSRRSPVTIPLPLAQKRRAQPSQPGATLHANMLRLAWRRLSRCLRLAPPSDNR